MLTRPWTAIPNSLAANGDKNSRSTDDLILEFISANVNYLRESKIFTYKLRSSAERQFLSLFASNEFGMRHSCLNGR